MIRCFDLNIINDDVLRNKVKKISAYINYLASFGGYKYSSIYKDKSKGDVINYIDRNSGITFSCNNKDDNFSGCIEIVREDDINTIVKSKKTVYEIDGIEQMVCETYYEGSKIFIKDDNGKFTILKSIIDKFGAKYEFNKDTNEFNYVGTLKNKRLAKIEENGIVYTDKNHNGEIIKFSSYENKFGLKENMSIIEFKNKDRYVKTYSEGNNRSFSESKYISNGVATLSQKKYTYKDDLIVEIFESGNCIFYKIYIKDEDGNYNCYYEDNNKSAILKVNDELLPLYFTEVCHKFFDDDTDDTVDIIYIRDTLGIFVHVKKKPE